MTGRQRLTVLAAVLVGTAAGLGAFTFVYAKGASYLTNDPSACANCHVMGDHFAAWTKSSHGKFAVCNDCHAPHTFVGKYVTKARNGFWHSFYFTTGRYPDPLRITPRNLEVTENACRYCHGEITDAIEHGAGASSAGAKEARGEGEPFLCTRCHNDVGHWVR